MRIFSEHVYYTNNYFPVIRTLALFLGCASGRRNGLSTTVGACASFSFGSSIVCQVPLRCLYFSARPAFINNSEKFVTPIQFYLIREPHVMYASCIYRQTTSNVLSFRLGREGNADVKLPYIPGENTPPH